jgi:hypothetical protein
VTGLFNHYELKGNQSGSMIIYPAADFVMRISMEQSQLPKLSLSKYSGKGAGISNVLSDTIIGLFFIFFLLYNSVASINLAKCSSIPIERQ